jgi:hypothetical protein
VPFLAVKEEFHPKRNQARQKLATLPVPRFQDLASDVYAELTRRYTTLIDKDVRVFFLQVIYAYFLLTFSYV